MRIRKIEPQAIRAEGLCDGLPYNTELVNADGIAIHFWCPLAIDQVLLQQALHKAMNARDIVMATWSFGEPSGFWAHEDIE